MLYLIDIKGTGLKPRWVRANSQEEAHNYIWDNLLTAEQRYSGVKLHTLRQNDSEYFVYEGSNLVYSIPGSTFYGVLRASVLRGSIYKDGDRIFVPDTEKLRGATKQDFDDFKVCSKGHIN